MEAIRETLDVKDGKVTVILPESFSSRRVEVIVLPASEVGVPAERRISRRRPSPLLAGTVIADDLIAPAAPASDWDALK